MRFNFMTNLTELNKQRNKIINDFIEANTHTIEVDYPEDLKNSNCAIEYWVLWARFDLFDPSVVLEKVFHKKEDLFSACLARAESDVLNSEYEKMHGYDCTRVKANSFLIIHFAIKKS